MSMDSGGYGNTSKWRFEPYAREGYDLALRGTGLIFVIALECEFNSLQGCA